MSVGNVRSGSRKLVGATESWIVIRNDKLLIHTENDGASYLRRGAEIEEIPTTLGCLQRCRPTLYEEAVKEILTAKKEHLLL